MKKLMSVMLGLSLFLGAFATISFAQDDKKTDEGKKKKKKKGSDDEKK
jgi:hypothetical protein